VNDLASSIRRRILLPDKLYRGRLAEDYDGIGQYVLVALAASSVGSAYRARIAAGDFGGSRIFPLGTPVVIRSHHGQIEILSLGNLPAKPFDEFSRDVGPYCFLPGDSAESGQWFGTADANFDWNSQFDAGAGSTASIIDNFNRSIAMAAVNASFPTGHLGTASSGIHYAFPPNNGTTRDGVNPTTGAAIELTAAPVLGHGSGPGVTEVIPWAVGTSTMHIKFRLDDFASALCDTVEVNLQSRVVGSTVAIAIAGRHLGFDDSGLFGGGGVYTGSYLELQSASGTVGYTRISALSTTDYYHLKWFHSTDGVLHSKLKIWKDGDPEPGAWNLDVATGAYNYGDQIAFGMGMQASQAGDTQVLTANYLDWEYDHGSGHWDDFTRTIAAGGFDIGKTSRDNFPWTNDTLSGFTNIYVDGNRVHLGSTIKPAGSQQYGLRFDAPFDYTGATLTVLGKGSFSQPDPVTGFQSTSVSTVSLLAITIAHWDGFNTDGGFEVLLQYSSWPDTYTFMGSPVAAPTFGAEYYIKAEYTNGSPGTLKAKYWLASDPEPGWIYTGGIGPDTNRMNYLFLPLDITWGLAGAAGTEAEMWTEWDFIDVGNLGAGNTNTICFGVDEINDWAFIDLGDSPTYTFSMAVPVDDADRLLGKPYSMLGLFSIDTLPTEVICGMQTEWFFAGIEWSTGNLKLNFVATGYAGGDIDLGIPSVAGQKYFMRIINNYPDCSAAIWREDDDEPPPQIEFTTALDQADPAFSISVPTSSGTAARITIDYLRKRKAG
jgi:hypothetical protein